uniref:Thioredoxin n=1 Tax=Roseihalotalea indica TaxID=2867963 RepID=A0AA49GK20_9BACT|nr:thioredoxin [Tunicatimonas sp. TK19036]
MKKQGKFSTLINGATPVLVDFSAEWCGPCKAMAPILSKLKAKVGGEVKVVKIDVDRNPALATQYRVQGVPTLILFHQGKPKWRQSGIVPLPELLKVLDTYRS